jgi:endonuclease YncB( thermonuclease family)
VRYIGMDIPETQNTVQDYGKQATNANKKLVQGRTIILVKDASEADQYGNLLRYVLVGNTFVNYELFAQGFAQVSTSYPDVTCQTSFINAERQARVQHLGIWAPIPTSPASGGSSGGSSGGGNPYGATAICNDGTYSFSQHRRGTCSHHGGVREWLKSVPP